MPNENWFSRLKIAGSHTAPIQSAGTNGKLIRAPSCAYGEDAKKTGLKSAKPKNDEQKNKNDRRREERKAQ